MKKILIFFFLAGTIAMIFVMGNTGKPLKTAETPNGILNLELTFSPQNATDVISAWTKTETQPVDIISAAKCNTWWDFVFIFFYASFLFLACLQIADTLRYKNFIYRTGKLLSRLIIVEVVLDVLENIGMFQLLNGNTSGYVTYFTTGCSIIKWLLVIIVILFVIIAGGFALITNKGKQSHGV